MVEQTNNDGVAPAASTGGRWNRKRIAGYVLGLVLVVGLIFAARWALTCPCDTMPGLVLWGEEVTEPVTDWSFANEVELCQIQVQGAVFSQALNLNCFATPDGQLYLSCSFCATKRWPRLAMANPDEGKIRLEGLVYPVSLTRVTDEAELDHAWETRLVKLVDSTVLGGGTPIGTPRDPGWWSFRVASRSE